MNCPARQEIGDYLLGKLSDSQFERVAAHLEVCDECEHVAVELDARSPPPFSSRIVSTLKARIAEKPSSVPPLLRESLDKAMRVARQDTAGADIDKTECNGDEEAQMQLLLDTLAPPRATDELGRLGGFRILEVLGVGGMGIVFRGDDLNLRRDVALKVLKPAAAAIPSAKERFLREARAAAAVEHDHVVTIHQISEDRGVPFFTMPLLAGVSLRDHLDACEQLPLAEVLRIGREAAEALDAAHQRGLLHRDVKPDNIWLEGHHRRAKLLDFGLARLIESDADLTATGQIVGTPRYMAPEQALGQAVDQRADLFSLGCVLYHMAAGQAPFSGNSATATLLAVTSEDPIPILRQVPGLPASFGQLVDRLLAKQVEDRCQSARQVVIAIEAIEAELRARPALPDEAIGKPAIDLPPRTRIRSLLALAVISLLTVLGVIITREIHDGKIVIEASDETFTKIAKHAPGKANSLSTPITAKGQWTPTDGWLPLIALLEPDAEAHRGAFRVVDGRLVSAGTRLLIPFPVEIRGDYDLEAIIDNWIIKENHHADFFLPTGDGQSLLFRLGIDAANTGSGCCFRASSERVPYSDLPFAPGDRVHLALRVRRAGDLVMADAVINGQQVISRSREFNGSSQPDWPPRLTLMDLMPTREYRDLRLRMVTGTAEILANPASPTTARE